MSEPTTKDNFGTCVFNDAAMRERLPKNTYKSLRRTIDNFEPLEPAVADTVASAIKDWAVEKGATHFCHWFQPLTGLTAEKHDAFISPMPDGRAIMDFSGKELIKGEPDASSFPSGGLRATFEARGYTAWDCTSPVFVKNGILYIPSVFASYTGDALDKKTPLLRSMSAIQKQSLRVLRALGNTTSKRVDATMGPEQEYFLVDKSFFAKRLDLVLTGRTLFGAPPPRGQEMEDHYFGTMHERVASFMDEANRELWKLGVVAKTQHNEVAPAQYELAPLFTTINIAADHNQLVMEVLQKVALHHGFVCLLHEKPFAGVNGSGKHVNWSLSTDDGMNLLEPGNTPHDNMVFLVFLCAVVGAVDKYSKLLRAMVATTGNEHRLGANEAPPAIVSIFLGEELTGIIDYLADGGAIDSKKGMTLELGVSTLPPLPKDSTDRNRTSPFAFTGNKFEFRMVGSSQSTSTPATALNTIVAHELSAIADELEKGGELKASIGRILKKIATEHRRVILNGDNYTNDWVAEAERRGLPNLRSSVEATATLCDPENAEVYGSMGVLSKSELHARMEIHFETYVKMINIEGTTALRIARRQIVPAVAAFTGELGGIINDVTSAGVTAVTQTAMLKEIAGLLDELYNGCNALEAALSGAQGVKGIEAKAKAYHDKVIPAMAGVRKAADALELLVDAELWPLPTYAEMLFLR